MRDRSGWIPDFIHSHSLCRMDYRQIQSYGKGNQLSSVVQAVFRFILWISGVKLTVIGEENVPTDGAGSYIGNHRSIF